MDETKISRAQALRHALGGIGCDAEQIHTIFNAVMDIHPRAFHIMSVDKKGYADFSPLKNELASLDDIPTYLTKRPTEVIEFMDPKWEPPAP